MLFAVTNIFQVLESLCPGSNTAFKSSERSRYPFHCYLWVPYALVPSSQELVAEEGIARHHPFHLSQDMSSIWIIAGAIPYNPVPRIKIMSP